MTDSDIATRVELSEARAYARLIAGAPQDVSKQYGLSTHKLGSAYAVVAAGFVDSLIANRVIGLGGCEPATDEILDALDAVYSENGVATYAYEIAPSSEPADLPARLRDRGFVPFKQTTLLYRRVEVIAPPPCDFRVSRIGIERAAAFADMSCEIFELDGPFPSLLRATFNSPAWQHWMAFDGDVPVATAITHVVDNVAWIGWVGTLPDYRGRGAQSAITAAQLEGARASNCLWVTLETVTGTKNRPSQTLRNYRRLGWTVAYNRLVYVRKSTTRAESSPGDRAG